MKFNPFEILEVREISNILSFKITRQVSIEFYIQPTGKLGKKVYIFGL